MAENFSVTMGPKTDKEGTGKSIVDLLHVTAQVQAYSLEHMQRARENRTPDLVPSQTHLIRWHNANEVICTGQKV